MRCEIIAGIEVAADSWLALAQMDRGASAEGTTKAQARHRSLLSFWEHQLVCVRWTRSGAASSRGEFKRSSRGRAFRS